MDLFQTDLKQISNFIKYSKEKVILKKLVEEDSAYQNMTEEAYEMKIKDTGETNP